MIVYKSAEEIELIRESSLLVAKTHAELARVLRPGITTLELDRLSETFIRDHGGIPAFKGYQGFPNSICVSPNEVVVHGIPNSKPLTEGTILSVDCGVLMNGFYGDSAYTYAIGEISKDVRQLLQTTYDCLTIAIERMVVGNRLGDVSWAIQQHAEQAGYTVVRELIGHGVGRQLHEPPDLPNYGKRGRGERIKNGLVIAIEPMINMGQRFVVQDWDGWAIRTADRKPSGHYEHTVAVINGKAEKLSTFDYLEQALSENKNNSVIIR
ncbi:MAG: type I methionyl aminopeptidase [Bacteroidales bacterium]|nr:type I methionyl aminopeptidase [Bacteroidales bacterium]